MWTAAVFYPFGHPTPSIYGCFYSIPPTLYAFNDERGLCYYPRRQNNSTYCLQRDFNQTQDQPPAIFFYDIIVVNSFYAYLPVLIIFPMNVAVSGLFFIMTVDWVFFRREVAPL
jgi:hypothetical protein